MDIEALAVIVPFEKEALNAVLKNLYIYAGASVEPIC